MGDVLESLTFAYVVDESTILEGTVTDDNCAGEVTVENNEMMYCRMSMTIENLTVMGIYEPWPFGNPTLPFNPIFSTWEVLTEDQRRVLMDNDHMYLGVTIDRGALPTSSTAEAAEWLEALGKAVQDGSYTDEEVELYYTDIISGTRPLLGTTAPRGQHPPGDRCRRAKSAGHGPAGTLRDVVRCVAGWVFAGLARRPRRALRRRLHGIQNR